jgi:hypothetical protein
MEETNKRLHDTMDHVVQYTVCKSCVLINTSYESELNDILRLTHYRHTTWGSSARALSIIFSFCPLETNQKTHLYNFFLFYPLETESRDRLYIT